jgi:hypothetical protein
MLKIDNTLDIEMKPMGEIPVVENNDDDKVKPGSISAKPLEFTTQQADRVMFEQHKGDASRLIGVGNTGIGSSKHDVGITLDQLNRGMLNQVRADRQPFMDKMFNSTVGGITSGVLTAVEGFANVGDHIANFAQGEASWERGLLSQALHDVKADLNEVMPVYKRNPDKVWDVGDSGFWFELWRGVLDSAIGFGIPGAAYGGAVSKLGGALGKIDIMGRRLDVLTKYAGKAMGVGGAIAPSLGVLTAASLSNFNEGLVLGLEVYDTEKEKYTQMGLEQALENKRRDAIENGANDEDLLNIQLTQEERDQIELTAIDIAGDAADYTMAQNRTMLLSNMMQVKSIFALRSGMKGATANSRNLVKKPTFKQFWKDQLHAAPIEGAEEMIQNAFGMEARYQSQEQAIRDGLTFKEEDLIGKDMDWGTRMISFATSDEALLEGLMGFISGPIQYGITVAPFNKKQVEQQTLRYNQQQATIGSNGKYIKDMMLHQETAKELVGRFNEYRDNVLKKKGNEELTKEESEQYFNLIEDTSFDILAVENFFSGTTEKLQEELGTVLQDENATPEEKQTAEKLLGRLEQLETRFNKYAGYSDGHDLFTKELRSERLDQIYSILGEAYPALEREATKSINAKLEILFKDKKLSSDNMGDNIYIENEDGTKTPLNSVKDILNALSDEASGRLAEGSAVMTSKKFNELLDGANIQDLMLNRRNLRTIESLQNDLTVAIEESKTLDHEDLYTRFREQWEDISIDTKEKIEGIGNLLKDKRFTNGKNADLKGRIERYLNNLKGTLGEVERNSQFENNEAKQEHVDTAKNETIEKKTKQPAPSTTQSAPSTSANTSPFGAPLGQGTDPNQAPPANPKLAPQKQPTPNDNQEGLQFAFDGDDSLTNEQPVTEQQDNLEETQQTPTTTETTPTETTTTAVQEQVNVPVTQVATKDDTKQDQDEVEIKPTREEEKTHGQLEYTKIVQDTSKKSEKTLVNNDPIKVSETASGNFMQYLANGKDKTGNTLGVRVDLTAAPAMGASVSQATKAVALINKIKNEGRQPTSDEETQLVKYLPVRIDVNENINTYMFNMNPKYDVPNSKFPQKKSEIALKKAAINAFLNGGEVSVKVKGQLPGMISFGDERQLSEITAFESDPMTAELYVTIGGDLSPVNRNQERNPFSLISMKYTADGKSENWEGQLVLNVPAMNGMSFPLKLNTRSHDMQSSKVVTDLLSFMLLNDVNNVPLFKANPELYATIDSMFPTMKDAYGQNMTAQQVLGDLVYHGPKTRGNYGELFFEKGILHVAGQVFDKNQIQDPNNIKLIQSVIAQRKGFNVSTKMLMGNGDMAKARAYRKHVFSSYVSTNADINNMFTSKGGFNPTGNSLIRMQKGSLYLDPATITTTAPINLESKTKTTNLQGNENINKKKDNKSKIKEINEKRKRELTLTPKATPSITFFRKKTGTGLTSATPKHNKEYYVGKTVTYYTNKGVPINVTISDKVGKTETHIQNVGSDIKYTPILSTEGKELGNSNAVFSAIDNIEEINAKYDAEIAILEGNLQGNQNEIKQGLEESMANAIKNTGATKKVNLMPEPGTGVQFGENRVHRHSDGTFDVLNDQEGIIKEMASSFEEAVKIAKTYKSQTKTEQIINTKKESPVSESISDNEYNAFLDLGVLSDSQYNNIINKIRNNIQLTEREQFIKNDSWGNKIIQDKLKNITPTSKIEKIIDNKKEVEEKAKEEVEKCKKGRGNREALKKSGSAFSSVKKRK